MADDNSKEKGKYDKEAEFTLKPDLTRRAPDGYIAVADYQPKSYGIVFVINLFRLLKRNAVAILFGVIMAITIWGIYVYVVPRIPTIVFYIGFISIILAILSGVPSGVAILRKMSKRVFLFIFRMKGTKDIVGIDTQRKYGENLLWHETTGDGIELRETRDYVVNSGRLNKVGTKTLTTDHGIQLLFGNDFDPATQSAFGNIVGTPLHYEVYGIFDKPEFVLSPRLRSLLKIPQTGDEQAQLHMLKVKDMLDEGLSMLRAAAKYADENLTHSGDYYVESLEKLDSIQRKFILRMKHNIDTFEPYDKTPKAMLYHAEKYLQDMQLTAERQFELKMERDKIKMEGQEEMMAMVSIRPEVNPTLHQMFKDAIKKPLIIKTLEGMPGPLQEEALRMVQTAYQMRSVIQEETDNGESQE